MNNTNRNRLIGYSLVILVFSMFGPLFDTMGGFFPKNYLNLFDVFELLEKNGSGDLWVVQFAMTVFVAAALLLFFSLCKTRFLSGLSAFGGTVGLVYLLICYINQYSYDLEDLFDPDSTGISFGIWLCLILFIAAFITTVKGAEDPAQTNPAPTADSYDSAPAIPADNSPLSPPISENPQPQKAVTYCPNCGSALEEGEKFCGMCGHPR